MEAELGYRGNLKRLGVRAFALTAVLSSAAAFSTRAQEYPRWECFGGFSYANVGLGPQANLFGPVSKNYYGIHLGVNFNPYRNFSVVLTDLGIQTRGSRIPPPFRHSNNEVDTSQWLFGPELKIRSRKANGFAHALVGVTNTRLAIRVLQADYVPTRLGGKWQNDFRVSMGVVFRFGYTDGR